MANVSARAHTKHVCLLFLDLLLIPSNHHPTAMFCQHCLCRLVCYLTKKQSRQHACDLVPFNPRASKDSYADETVKLTQQALDAM